MKFVVETDIFESALVKAKGTISSRDSNPILKNFLLKVNGKTLNISSTNLDLAVVANMQIKSGVEGIVTVNAEKLLKIAQLSDSTELEFVVSDGSAVVTTGKYSATLATLPSDDFPTITEFESSGSPQECSREEFVRCLDKISFSIADSEQRKNLLAVNINDGYMQATDGHVSSVVAFKVVNDTVIPSSAVADLVRILRVSTAETIVFAKTNSFLMFKLDTDLFISRLTQIRFPDIIKRGLNVTVNNPITVKIAKHELISTVNRVSTTASKNDYALNLSIETDGTMNVSSSDELGNNSTEVIPVDVTGATGRVEIKLNYTYLLDIMGSFDSDVIVIKISEDVKTALRFEDGEFIAMLMRLATVNKDSLDSDKKYWDKNNVVAGAGVVAGVPSVDADVTAAVSKSKDVISGRTKAGRTKYKPVVTESKSMEEELDVESD